MHQLTLLGAIAEVELDERLAALRRTELEDDAWVEHCPAFLRGHAALYEHIRANARWRVESQRMYDKDVTTPRLIAVVDDAAALHPILPRIQRLLRSRYATAFARVSLAHYRDGHDSVAPHGDYVARSMGEALVATVSVGAPRRLRLTRRQGPGSLSFMLGEGDLFVMGGTCQRTWRHGIAKVARAEPRISIMFRPAWPPAPAGDEPPTR